MKAKVDSELCIGCGNCEALYPAIFKLKDDNKAHVIGSCDGQEDCCREAEANCPVGAISIEE